MRNISEKWLNVEVIYALRVDGMCIAWHSWTPFAFGDIMFKNLLSKIISLGMKKFILQWTIKYKAK
jgi:citrate lyase alpha subunit